MFETLSLETNEGDAGAKLREWSSLIGIVTAIVGNILISFALNIQRYAHIRLGREQEESNEQCGGGHTTAGHRDYGTQQSRIAEERARFNLNAPAESERTTKKSNGTEASSNGASCHEESLHSRSSSESTIKPNEKLRHQEDRKSYLKSPYWWVGIILMICGEAGNFIAYGFAPASIVSPLGVVALVSNCIIAPALLKERFRQRDFWGVAIAIAGAVTIVLSAKNSETKMGPDDVWAAITRWEFETYLGITAALMVVLMWASGTYGEKSILIDLGLVGLFGMNFRIKLFIILTVRQGGYTALSTKGVASLLSDTLWRALTFPITYLLVLILVVTALLQIRYVNRALQRFDSTQVIPVQFVLFTISVIIGSAVLYRDFQAADASRFGKFFGGCALTFLGVYLITSGRRRGADEQGHDGMDDEENAIGMVDEERYQDEIHNEDEENRSRRKSSVSFAVQGSPRNKSPRTPPPLLSHNSTASSRVSSADSPLLETPGEVSQRRPRPLESTISSPLLPSEAQRSDPPSTPQASRGERLSPSKAGRPSTLSRRSMARLTPGPLLSPLSSSLSAVVADNLRKGLHSPSVRRRSGPGPPQLRPSRSARSSTGDDLVTGPSPSKVADSPPEATVDERPPATGRSQSVSATLGEFFRLKRERSKGKTGDEETDDTQG